MNLGTSILRSTSPFLLVAMGLYGMGCIADPNEMGPSEEETVDHVSLGIGGDPGTSNHYRIECFQDHGIQQTYRDLAGNPLVGTTGNELPDKMYYLPNPSESGDLAGCRTEALDLLVQCALTPSQQVVDTRASLTHTGELGYAPAWTSRGLTTSEKELVTACMLQRLNPNHATIPILLEQPTLPKSPADFPLHESEAWGNLFDSTVVLNPTRDPALPTDVPFTAYACDDGGRPTSCSAAGGFVVWNSNYSLLRTCYFHAADCNWKTYGICMSTCTPDTNDPRKCDAWINRLRTRTRDDGSICGQIIL